MSVCRSLLRALLLLAILGGWSAASIDAAAFTQQRLVQQYDFDERDAGNFEKLPMAWYVIGRESLNPDAHFNQVPLHETLLRRGGYPHYNTVGFDTRQKTSGRESLYLDLRGGNVGAFLEVGALPAVPNSDYQLTVNVRTTNLKFARARFTAYFIDPEGRAIDASASHSGAVTTNGRWQTLSLTLLGDYPRAAYIGMQVELLQPVFNPDSPLGDRQVVYEEVEGGAWFDDVRVWQLPSVSLETQTPVNVVRAPRTPLLMCKVRDLTGRPLRTDLAIYDLRLNTVAREERQIGAGEPSHWQWSPSLPRFGWYLADLTLYEATSENGTAGESSAVPRVPIARTLAALLWLPDEPLMHAGDAARFALLADALPEAQLRLMAPLLDLTGLGAMTISAWDAETTRATLDRRQQLLDETVQPILARGREVTFNLSPMPMELSRLLGIEADTPLAAFSHSSRAWHPLLAPVVLRHSQRVRKWQIGSVDNPMAFYMSDIASVVDGVREQLLNLAPQPRLVLPWRLDQARRPDIEPAITYLIDVPPAVRPDTIGEHLQEWRDSPSTEFVLRLREPPATQLDHQSRLENLTLRMLHGWEAGAAGLSLTRPWTTADQRRVSLMPDPLLGGFVGVSHRLAGRRAVQRLDLGEGLVCIIFDGPAGGMLAAWNRHAATRDAVIDMYLGAAPEVVDIFGNRSALAMTDGRHRVALDRMPIFIEGIDPELARFRASFKLDKPFIESLQTPHDRTVTIYNPWPRTISGHMLVVGPEQWHIEPRRTFFSIAAGDSSRIPLQLVFPVSEVAGTKRLEARFDFTAEQRYTLNVSTAMELGLEEVDFDASIVLESSEQGPADVVVTALVTNRGSESLALYAFTNVPGQPRQERVISGLRPGQSAVRRFRFPAAAEDVTGSAIRVGLRQSSGPAMLNKILTLEDVPRPRGR